MGELIYRMPNDVLALLRGVNLGGNKRVPMADLKALVEGLGFTDVRTLLNSGNVVFTARSNAVRNAATRIQQAVLDGLGVSSKVTVLTAAELDTVLDENPHGAICDNPSASSSRCSPSRCQARPSADGAEL